MHLLPQTSLRMNMMLFVMLFIVLVPQSTGQAYYPETEIYCDGEILKFPEGKLDRRLQCCGKAVYNWESARCCDGNVVQIPNNGSVYGEWECCGDNWQFSQDSYFEQCCKNKFYNTAKQICNVETGEVFDKDSNADLGFCEGNAYNKSYQQCSNDGTRQHKDSICEKSERMSAMHCCGSKPFSIYDELCCIDTVHPIYNNTRDKLINQCCGRNVFPTPDYFRNRFTYIGKFTCCGDVVIEKSSISEQCCGSIRYNTSESLCCEGVLVENVSFGDRCCGKTSYNTELSWCCNGNVYPLSFTPQDCYYNYGELKDLLNSESEKMEKYIWVYDRYLSDSKSIYHRRNGAPGRPDF